MSSLAFSAVIAALMFGVLFTVAAERRKSADDIALPVVGAECAPAFVDWLKQQTGVTIVAAPDDPERAVRERDETSYSSSRRTSRRTWRGRCRRPIGAR